MSDDTPEFTRHNTDGLVAPIIAGALLQNLLYGVLIAVFVKFVGSPSWTRQSGRMKSVIVVVTLLTTASTGLYMHDIFFYSLTFTEDFTVLDRSTVAEGVEPVLVGVIGAIVQQTLCARAARLIATSWIRWLYVTVVGLGSLLAVLSSIGVSASSVSYSQETVYTDDLPFPIQIDQFIQAWAWSSAVTDALLSISYIVIIRIKAQGANEVAKGALRIVVRYVLESAMFTTIFALASAITIEATNANDPSQYDMSYITWMPCSSLYALSLFTTLNIADRVKSQLSDFPQPQLTVSGSFFTASRRASLAPPRRSISPGRRSPLESMVTSPGEPAWAQRSTSFLGVKMPLERLESENVDVEGERSSMSRSQSSAV